MCQRRFKKLFYRIWPAEDVCLFFLLKWHIWTTFSSLFDVGNQWIIYQRDYCQKSRCHLFIETRLTVCFLRRHTELMGLALQALKIHHSSGGVFVVLAFILFLFFNLLKLVRAFTINSLYTSDEAFLEKTPSVAQCLHCRYCFSVLCIWISKTLSCSKELCLLAS